jgi:hypothetical protein
MAILRVPKITTSQRLELILSDSEIVYDSDLKRYYGGDNIRTGGFPIGEGAEPYIETIIINQTQLDEKKIILENFVSNVNKTRFTFINGTTQLLNIDYIFIDNQTISWDNLGLDNFIEIGDIILIEYW